MRPILFYIKSWSSESLFLEVFMRLLLLLLLSITNIFAQEKVLGVDIPKDFIVDYDEWDNEYCIVSSNMKESREEIQKKGFLENNHLTTIIKIIDNTTIILYMYNFFWEDSKYQDKSEELTNVTVYIKNNGKILKKEIEVILVGGSNFSMLMLTENSTDEFDLSFILDNLNENSTLRIKDFADNVFEYEGEDLKPLLDTIKLYKQLKQK